MIETMSIFAFGFGILFGYWCFGKRPDWLFVTFHTAAFSSKRRFYELYDMADDEITYKFYTDHNRDIKSYADYLRLHAEARSSAYKSFSNTYGTIKRLLAFRILPISLIPAILFWSHWYFYVGGVAVAIAIPVVLEIYKYGLRPGFYQRLAVYVTLSAYTKDEKQTPK